MELVELRDYTTTLDEYDHIMIEHEVAEKGITQYLNQQLIHLDCSRIIQGMRMMQTIGYPYQRVISSYLYAIGKYITEDKIKRDLYDRLLAIHALNLAYEKENPPIWYGGKKAKNKWDKEHSKPARRKKCSEQTIHGMGKEISNKERLKKLSAQFGNLTFKIKPFKKDD